MKNKLIIRVFNLLLALCLTVGLSQAAAAQSVHDLMRGDDPAPAEAPAAPEVAPAPETGPPPAKDYPERYVAEMEGFADYCAKDSYLSRHYDCGCMAVKYIDKRVEMGDTAGSADIITAISRECLFEKRETIAAGDSAFDLSTLTDEQIAEMQNFYDGCTQDPQKSAGYDCECLAARFMEKRLERGPFVGQDSIMLELDGACPNGTDMAGATYNECMNMPPLPLIRGSQEEYCECYANNIGKLYAESEGLAPEIRANLKGRAQIMCMNLPVNIPAPQLR